MRKVHKYTIPVTQETQSVQLPIGGHIVHVDSKTGVKYDEIAKTNVGFVDFWVMFPDDSPGVETRYFETIATGKPIDEDLSYMGTVVLRHEQIFGGAEVYHLFEKHV